MVAKMCPNMMEKLTQSRVGQLDQPMRWLHHPVGQLLVGLGDHPLKTGRVNHPEDSNVEELEKLSQIWTHWAKVGGLDHPVGWVAHPLEGLTHRLKNCPKIQQVDPRWHKLSILLRG